MICRPWLFGERLEPSFKAKLKVFRLLEALLLGVDALALQVLHAGACELCYMPVAHKPFEVVHLYTRNHVKSLLDIVHPEVPPQASPGLLLPVRVQQDPSRPCSAGIGWRWPKFDVPSGKKTTAALSRVLRADCTSRSQAVARPGHDARLGHVEDGTFEDNRFLANLLCGLILFSLRDQNHGTLCPEARA